MLPEEKTAPKARPYLYELDRLRVVTVCSVIAVHVLSKTTFLDQSLLALQIQNAFVTAFHFTRETFMFVTAFALVYVYSGKPFTLGRFWKRRGLGVVLPYVIWSAIYLWIILPSHAPLLFLHTLSWDLLTGNASYQLYYILLTIQFYLLFPCLLSYLRHAQRHPWTTLALSFLLEVSILYAISKSPPSASSLPGNTGLVVDLLQERFVLVYQFYFVLGGMAALHLQQIRAFVLRYHPWIFGGFIAALIALELHYTAAIEIEQIPIGDAVAVLQPIMAFYSVAVIAFLYGQSYWSVLRQAARAGSEHNRRIWQMLSNASFGVYLVHPLFLTPLLALIATLHTWPAAVLVILTWFLATTASFTFSIVLLNLPLLSRLVGRETPQASWLTLLARKQTLYLRAIVGNRFPFRDLARREEDS